MPRRYFNDGQEIVNTDLSYLSSSLEIELYDRIFYQLMNRQRNIVFGDSFVASYVNATTSQVKLGHGVYYDSTQVDPEPKTRLLHLAANTNVTHTAANATFNRIDIICVTPARATILSENRNFKDAGTSAISSVSMVVETDWAPTLSVTAGTPSGSPAVPATPAGAIKIAEVLVTAVTGIGSSAAYTDKRPRFGKPSSWVTPNAVTSATTMDLDDEFVVANCNGGAFAYTLQLASLCNGKRLSIAKADASANALTITAAGSDLINGLATQVLSVQYTTMTLLCDGTSWYIES
jgi:hypothetical protein